HLKTVERRKRLQLDQPALYRAILLPDEPEVDLHAAWQPFTIRDPEPIRDHRVGSATIGRIGQQLPDHRPCSLTEAVEQIGLEETRCFRDPEWNDAAHPCGQSVEQRLVTGVCEPL